MTIRLAGAIENAIRDRFQNIFNDDKATIAAITVLKFKLKWAELQSKKDLYKQMFIQQMRLHTADNGVVAVQESQDHSAEKKNDKFMIVNLMMKYSHRAVQKLRQTI